MLTRSRLCPNHQHSPSRLTDTTPPGAHIHVRRAKFLMERPTLTVRRLGSAGHVPAIPVRPLKSARVFVAMGDQLMATPTRSARFIPLLPDGVIACESRVADSDTLLPEEAELVATAVNARQSEFAAGRACARSALTDMGVGDPEPIIPDEHRAPIWPSGFVGSITHCTGLAAAAVARADTWLGIGIDAEPAEPLPQEVVDLVLDSTEQFALTNLPDLGVPWDRVAFSAKESLYKVWSPLQHTWLGFEDVALDLDTDGTFTVQLGPPDIGKLPRTMSGRWAVTDGLVITTLAVQLTRQTVNREHWGAAKYCDPLHITVGS